MKISVVTTNKGKFDEINRMILQKGHSAENINAPYPEIQTDSLEIVIIQGLYWMMKRHDRPIIIDDSGLFIDALNGFPGVYSSYIYRTVGCEGVLRLMSDIEKRSAHFKCCLGFMEPGKEPHIFNGISEGSISTSMRGDGGFGFDPIFIPVASEETFAEISMDAKNKISHRGKAIEKFLRYLE